jgi:hypothetical protein
LLFFCVQEVLAVLDVDPQRLAALPPFRRWAFQVTEPWCKEGALAPKIL